MGTVGREVVGEYMADEIISELNRGIAAEINDAYRYLLLSKVAAGIHSGEAADLFARTAQDEWGHVATLLQRVTELGGRPLESPADARDLSYAEYKPAPKDETDVRRMLEDSLAGERAAIRFYMDLYRRTRETDPVTADIARAALADEISDEDELERLAAGWPAG